MRQFLSKRHSKPFPREETRKRLSNTRLGLTLCLATLMCSCIDLQYSSSDATNQLYATDFSTGFIQDKSRPFDAIAGVNSRFGNLITELWYPVDHSSYSLTRSDPALAIEEGDQAFLQAMVDSLPLLDDQCACGLVIIVA
jgi:hypothetical protein